MNPVRRFFRRYIVSTIGIVLLFFTVNLLLFLAVLSAGYLSGTKDIFSVERLSEHIGPVPGRDGVWEADETGILFVANIGYSGADAYVDMREHTAEWVDNSTAIFQEGDNWIVFTYYDGILTVSENPDALYGALSISGVYVLAEEADYPDCEFVFPDSSEFEVMEVSCDGLTAEECRIAKNEIYARHGRMFSDPVLQNYFDSCSWYVPGIAPEDFTEDMLSEVERQSIRGIEAYEGYMGY